MLLFTEQPPQTSSTPSILERATSLLRKHLQYHSDSTELSRSKSLYGRMLTKLLDWTAKKDGQEITLIDLRPAIQMVRNYDQGFSTFFPLNSANVDSQNSKREMKIRKKLLKQRYFKILEKEEIESGYRTVKKMPVVSEQSRPTKIRRVDFPQRPKQKEDLILLKTAKKAEYIQFEQKNKQKTTFFMQKDQQSDDMQKAVSKLNSFQKSDQPELTPVQPTSELISQTEQRPQKIQTNQNIVSKQIEPVREKGQNEKQIIKQTSTNPFLSKTYQKLDLNKIIFGNSSSSKQLEIKPCNDQFIPVPPAPTLNPAPHFSPQATNFYMGAPTQNFSQFCNPNSPNYQAPKIILSSSSSQSNFGFVMDTPYNVSINLNQNQMPGGFLGSNSEKQQTISTFFSNPAPATSSLFYESERTSKKSKARPSRKEKARIS